MAYVLRIENGCKRRFNRRQRRKKLIAFAIPLAIASFVQALYNLADMPIVGHYIGSAGMSAVTMGGLVANVVLTGKWKKSKIKV